MEYLTVADVRDEYGDLVEAMTDTAIRRRLDRLSAYMEDALGHAFGRALMARSTAGDTVQVTDTGLVIGGDAYAFADYPTLGALVDAANAAGASYSLTPLPVIDPNTPSELLKATGTVACGPTYADWVVLDLEALWVKASGDGTTHLFLPLPVQEVQQVTEDGVAIDATAYEVPPDASWLIRKLGRWSTRATGNVEVIYRPRWWGNAPGVVSEVLLEAFGVATGNTPIASERFGDYSYQRKVPEARPWQEVLSDPALRPYAVRFHP